MIAMTLQQAAANTSGSLSSEQYKEITFSAVATDTRKPMPESLFIALKGNNFNAHDYLEKAKAQGAIACMLDEDRSTSLPVLKVSNTLFAMAELARSVRDQLSIPCIGITGSSGKTTVKEMLANILAIQGKVLATQGNFNNAIGVPLTLFRLSKDDQFAVIEMGASQVGDIDQLAQWVKPDVALITNVSAAHLQGLGSIAGVAKVKGEIFAHLTKTGTAIVEQDSVWKQGWFNNLSSTQTSQTFSRSNPQADFFASAIQQNDLGEALFMAQTPMGSIEIQLSVSGLHNVDNALAAIAAAMAVGASLENCQQGLATLTRVKGRLQMSAGIGNCRIIDDSYNANPASLLAAMEVLKDFTGKRLLVLGDMGELAKEAEAAHTTAGQQAKQLGLDGLYGVGTLSAKAVLAFGDGAKHFENQGLLAEALIKLTSEDFDNQWTLLIKGSRSSAMDNLVTQLQKKGNQTCC